jgi:hypothetical protein
VLELAKWSLSQVTPEQWAGCVCHAIKEEDRYAEVCVDPFPVGVVEPFSEVVLTHFSRPTVLYSQCVLRPEQACT